MIRPRAADLGEQQRGDEKPRQHEEQVDPEVAARQVSEMMRDHPDDCDAAEPVERGSMAERRAVQRGGARAGAVHAAARPP
jgi:hypothetical protein